jgi:hypothetical protein
MERARGRDLLDVATSQPPPAPNLGRRQQLCVNQLQHPARGEPEHQGRGLNAEPDVTIGRPLTAFGASLLQLGLVASGLCPLLGEHRGVGLNRRTTQRGGRAVRRPLLKVALRDEVRNEISCAPHDLSRLFHEIHLSRSAARSSANWRTDDSVTQTQAPRCASSCPSSTNRRTDHAVTPSTSPASAVESHSPGGSGAGVERARFGLSFFCP